MFYQVAITDILKSCNEFESIIFLNPWNFYSKIYKNNEMQFNNTKYSPIPKFLIFIISEIANQTALSNHCEGLRDQYNATCPYTEIGRKANEKRLRFSTAPSAH